MECKALLEGTMHDELSRINYCPVSCPIPKCMDAIVVSGRKLVIHKKMDFNSGKILLMRAMNDPPKEGRLVDHSIDWAFEMPRFLLAGDGRAYVSKTYINNRDGFYFGDLDTLLGDAGRFFRGEISFEGLHKLGRFAYCGTPS